MVMDNNTFFAIVGLCAVVAYLGHGYIEFLNLKNDREMEERLLLAGYQRDYVQCSEDSGTDEYALEWVYKGRSDTKPSVMVENHFDVPASPKTQSVFAYGDTRGVFAEAKSADDITKAIFAENDARIARSQRERDERVADKFAAGLGLERKG